MFGEHNKKHVNINDDDDFPDLENEFDDFNWVAEKIVKK